MGCDIHCTWEARRDGEWENMDRWALDDTVDRHVQIGRPMLGERHYALFGELAGVRDVDADPIAEPRGIPDDAATETRRFYDECHGDAHTPSWLTLAEIDARYTRDKSLTGELWWAYHYMEEAIDALRIGRDDARLVFFFDN